MKERKSLFSVKVVFEVLLSKCEIVPIVQGGFVPTLTYGTLSEGFIEYDFESRRGLLSKASDLVQVLQT